jgi:hypothetical protein
MPFDVPRIFRHRSAKLIWFCICCAAAWFLFPWVLQAFAKMLISENPRESAGCLVLFAEEPGENSHRCYDAAAAAYREDPRRRILLIEPKPHTLQKYGILPCSTKVSRRELASRGVANAAIQQISGSAPNAWGAARLLGKWLEDHPQAEAIYYGERFQSRTLSCIHRQVLAPEVARRIGIYCLSAPEYDETNWWKTRNGVKAFMFGHLSLIYARFHGEPDHRQSSWDPEEYARGLNKP